MNNIKDEIQNQTYDTFRKLLRRGIGTRTQTQFAKETGISRGQINRMLNEKEIQRPSEKTIMILAQHIHSISAEELLKSCGYEVQKIEDAAYNVKEALIKAFETSKGAIYKNSLTDVLKIDTTPYIGSKCSWKVLKSDDMPENSNLNGEKFEVLAFTWDYYDNQYATTYILTGYLETASNNKVLCDFSFDIDSMIEGKYLENNKLINRDTSCYFGVKRPQDYQSAEERLLECIFGSQGKDTYITTYFGCGFYYTETPENFTEYVMENAAFFCVDKKRSALYRELVSTNKSPDEIFKDFCGMQEFEETGTGCVISDILTNKTGQAFHYLKKDKKLGDDVKDDSCIIVFDENVMDDTEIVNEDILRYSYEAAVALGIKEFGKVYHQNVNHASTNQIFNTDSFHYEFLDPEDAKKLIFDEKQLIRLKGKANKVYDYYYQRYFKDNDDKEAWQKSNKASHILVRTKHILKNLHDTRPTKEEYDWICEELYNLPK